MSPSLLDAPGHSGVCLYVCVRVCVVCAQRFPKPRGRKKQVNFCVALEPLVQLGGRCCWSERGQLVPALS